MKTFEMKSANRQECKFDEAKKSQSKTGTLFLLSSQSLHS